LRSRQPTQYSRPFPHLWVDSRPMRSCGPEATAAQGAGRPLRLLMLEGQPGDREQLIAPLAQAGFSVECRSVDSMAAMRQALGEGGWNAALSTVPSPPAAARAPADADRIEDARARQRQRTLAIHQLVAATSSTLDLEQVIDALLHNLRELLGVDRVGVMLLDPKTDRLTSAAACDADGRLPVGLQLARGEGAGGRVVKNARPLIVPDIRGFPQFAPPYDASQAHSAHVPRALGYAGFPLISRGRILGVVSLIDTSPRSFSAEEIGFVETLCRAAAVSVDNALAHQELQRRQQEEAQRSREKLRESERLRDSLVHMIVHDLRSPLAAVSGYLDMLATQAKDELGEEARSDIANATNAVRHMARMISGILDVNTMESQMMKLDVSECDLIQVVGQSLDELESLVGHRQVEFEHPTPPAVVLADSEIVTRIVQNLLANALRLTPADGEIRIGIVPGAAQTRVFVTDTGPGIAADFQAKIFDKYAHAEKSASCRGHTTGLGLTFCKLAVEAHGGQIGVDSEEGAGSTFWFTLPSCQVHRG
jgi:two-component system, sensor histidine kinase and response regulator